MIGSALQEDHFGNCGEKRPGSWSEGRGPGKDTAGQTMPTGSLNQSAGEGGSRERKQMPRSGDSLAVEDVRMGKAKRNFKDS